MIFRAVQRRALCRSRRELSNAYFVAKFGLDTAENEPCQVCPTEPFPAGIAGPAPRREPRARAPASARGAPETGGKNSRQKSRGGQGIGVRDSKIGKIGKFCKFLAGSFSAVSKRNFERKYAFDSIFQAPQDLHTFAPLQSQNFRKKSV